MSDNLEFLTKELIDRAFLEVDKNGIPKNRKGTGYVVSINGKNYPYKLLVTEAAKLAGLELKPNDFESSKKNRKDFEKLTGYLVISKNREMEYFTKAEFDSFSKNKGKNADSVSEEDKELIEKLHQKMKYLSDLIKTQINGSSVKSPPHIKNPFNGGINIKNYLWYRIYPNKEWEHLDLALALTFDGDFEYRLDSDKWHDNLFKRIKLIEFRRDKVQDEEIGNQDVLKYGDYDNLVNRVVDYFNTRVEPISEEILKIGSVKVGLLASDGTQWKEDHIEKARGFNYSILWNTKQPSGKGNSIRELNETIERNGHFDLFYLAEGSATYKAEIIGIAKTDKDLEKWIEKESEICDFSPFMGDYFDGDKKAYVVFISKLFKKLSKPIPSNKFSLYGKFELPRQDNLTPFFMENDIQNQTHQTNTNSTGDSYSALNQILFGPPGTGKTYSTVIKSLAIIEGKEEADLEDENYLVLKKRYDNLVKNGQIFFTTFHQSMSYEDFVEGIKPQAPKGDGYPVSYRVEAGIFKQISIDAKTNIELSTVKGATDSATPFDIAFRMLEDKIQEAHLDEPDETSGSMKKGLVVDLPNSFFSLTGIAGSSIRMMNRSGNEQNTMTKPTLQKIYEAPEKADEVIKGGMIGYYRALVNLMLSWSAYIKEEAKSIKEKKYVLIIDEINRGNISAVFGELITLIEESKRFGRDECIEVTLPYSKDTFSVPDNLYIIGTMNTADRSVEALDTALRRRFVFTEMPPIPSLLSANNMILQLWNKNKYIEASWDDEGFRTKADALNELLGVDSSFEEQFYGKEPEGSWNLRDLEVVGKVEFKGINLENLLNVINKRIGILLDKDHLIGHSFFMKVGSIQDLKVAFSKEIIPLLQEYFFGDYGKITLVLGEGFCIGKKAQSNVFATATDYEASVYEEKMIYTINDPLLMGDDAFLKAMNTLLVNAE